MADPLEVLRRPSSPLEPDPTFALALRTRIERVLSTATDEGTTMPSATTTRSTPALDVPANATSTGGADGRRDVESARPGDLAYVALWTPKVERAEAFYAAVLGWQLSAGSGPRGRQVVNTTLATGLWGGQSEHTVFCCWQVDDVDAAIARVRGAGGTAGEARDEPYGRLADCVDADGLAFAVFAPPAGAEPAPRTPLNGAVAGDLTYLTLLVPDRAAAVAFYSAVVGWRAPGDADPVDVHPMLGIAGGQGPQAVPCWKVDDVASAVERVVAAGGTAGRPEQRPYGVLAECTDDQGSPFYLSDT